MSASAHPPVHRVLRAPLIALAIGVVAAGGGWLGSLWLNFEARRSTDGLRATVIEARNELSRARAALETRAAYAAPFEALRKQGLLQGGDRLEWIEWIRGFEREQGLERLEYELAPGRRLEDLQGYDFGPYGLAATRIDLSAGLLHEGDLLALFETLRARHLGMVVPQHCRLERAAAPEGGSGLRARIGLHCSLIWLSLGPRKEHDERLQDAH